MARIDVATVTLRSSGRTAAIVLALLVLVLALSLPATSIAADGGEGGAPEGDRSSAGPLGVGAGYGPEAGSGPVRELQVRLRTLGYQPGPIDGRFGPLTQGAVERFQGAEGLAVDGVVGPRTQGALREARPGDQAGLRPVRELQHDLQALGFKPGPLDGVYGPMTRAAVERFQEAQGLAVDGVAGRRTLHTLAAQQQAPSSKPVDRARAPSPQTAAHRALADARTQPAQPKPSSLPEPSSRGGSSSPATAPGYLALGAALALVLLLTGVRAARRRDRTPAPTSRRRAIAPAHARFNTGLVCAVMLGGLVIGAAAGALFATRASPDEGAASTAGSLVSVGTERLPSTAAERPRRAAAERPRPSASRSKPSGSAQVETSRTARDGTAPAPAAASAIPPPASAAAPPDEPVLGAAEAGAAARARPAERPRRAAEPGPLAMDIARTAPDGSPWFTDEDQLVAGNSAAAAAGRLR